MMLYVCSLACRCFNCRNSFLITGTLQLVIQWFMLFGRKKWTELPNRHSLSSIHSASQPRKLASLSLILEWLTWVAQTIQQASIQDNKSSSNSSSSIAQKRTGNENSLEFGIRAASVSQQVSKSVSHVHELAGPRSLARQSCFLQLIQFSWVFWLRLTKTKMIQYGDREREREKIIAIFLTCMINIQALAPSRTDTGTHGMLLLLQIRRDNWSSRS